MEEKTGQSCFFTDLYDRQFLKMWTLAVALVKNSAQAEEIVQDAFVEVLAHEESVRQKEHPELWLQKVVKNKSLHVLRERNRCAKAFAVLESQCPAEPLEPKEFREVEEADSLKGIKEKISETLDPRELRLLQRVAMEGASYKTVSQELGLSVGACQKKVQRIREKLRKVIPLS